MHKTGSEAYKGQLYRPKIYVGKPWSITGSRLADAFMLEVLSLKRIAEEMLLCISGLSWRCETITKEMLVKSAFNWITIRMKQDTKGGL